MKTYKFRIYPNKQQREVLDQTIETCRLYYNQCLEERKKNPKLNYYDQQKQLYIIRKSNNTYKHIYAHVLQNIIQHLDNAFKRYFTMTETGYPNFKRFG